MSWLQEIKLALLKRSHAAQVLLLFALIVLSYGCGMRSDNRSTAIPQDVRTIDSKGNEVTNVKPDVAETVGHHHHEFSDDPAVKYLKESNMYAFYDGSGNLAIPKKFNRARAFSGGVAAVSDVSYSGQTEDPRMHLSFGSAPWRFIDKSGKTVIQGPFARVSEFHAGRAIVTTLDRPWNPICIDITGKTVFDNLEFTEVYPFSDDGFAIVSKGWPPLTIGLVDRNGKVVTGVRMENFSEGLGAFRDRKTGRVGYIDSAGQIVIKPQYFQAKPFCHGLAAVAVADTAATEYAYSTCAQLVWDYIDKTGKRLGVRLNAPTRPIRYASDFDRGLAKVIVETPQPIQKPIVLPAATVGKGKSNVLRWI